MSAPSPRSFASAVRCSSHSMGSCPVALMAFCSSRRIALRFLLPIITVPRKCRGALAACSPRRQSIGARATGRHARVIEDGNRELLDQAEQAEDWPHPGDATLLVQSFGPLADGRTEGLGAVDQVLGAAFDSADLGRVQMSVEGAEAAGAVANMRGDQLEALVEDAHQAGVPAHPDGATQVLRRHGVVGAADLDVTVAMNHALAFLEVGESLRRQRQQRRLLDLLEDRTDLPTRRAVNACVGHGPFPIEQITVLLLETREGATFERVLLYVVDATFDLALVPRRVRFGRQQRDAVMPAER